MTAHYVIDPEHSVVYSKATGELTYPDLDAHDSRLASDPGFHPGLRQVFDFRHASSTDITPGRLRDIALRDPFEAGAKRAFVVCIRQAEIDWLVRLYLAFATERGHHLTVCRSLLAACLCLEVPPFPSL